MKIDPLHHILSLPRITKRLIVVFVDVIMSVVAVWLAFYLRLGDFIPLFKQTAEHIPLFAVIGSVSSSIPIFMLMGLYLSLIHI